jgi:hypothetical protein
MFEDVNNKNNFRIIKAQKNNKKKNSIKSKKRI